MKLIKVFNIKFTMFILIIIYISTFTTNSLAVQKIYTSKLVKGNQLKFTGTAWKVFKTKKSAKSVANGKNPTAKRFIKNKEKIRILEIDGNVLKIAEKEYIYYGSTASKYFKDTKEQTIGSKEQEGNFYIPEAKIRVEEISLNVTDITLKVGDSKTLVATVKPTNAENKKIKWSTSNSNAAIVDNGKVIAKNIGDTIITAKAQDGSGKSTTAKIHVVAKTTSNNSCNHPANQLVKVNPRNPHGYLEHEVDILCKKCNKVIGTGTDSHHLGDWITIKDATCTKDGEKRKVCQCGYYESQKIEKTGHVNNKCWKITKIENDIVYHQKKTLCLNCREVLRTEKEKHAYKYTSGIYLDSEHKFLKNTYICNCKTCGAIKVEIVDTKKLEVINRYMM